MPEFIEVTNRRGELVSINPYKISTMTTSVDDYKDPVLVIKMTNGDSIYVPIEFSSKLKCSKK